MDKLYNEYLTNPMLYQNECKKPEMQAYLKQLNDKREVEDDQNKNIPEKYKILLQEVLILMETETGNKYKITVNKFGNHNNLNCVIGDFNNRGKVEVYDMDSDYKQLEGIYDSIKAVESGIKTLQQLDVFEEVKKDSQGKLIGKCKYCHSYNENVPYQCPNYDSVDICQACHTYLKDKSLWYDLKLDISGNIYHSSGGSLSICHKKGSFKFV